MEKTKKTTTTTTTKIAPLSDGAKKALDLLNEFGSLTTAEMKTKGFENANSSHLTALKKRGLIDSEQVEIEVQVVQKRKVQKYFIKK